MASTLECLTDWMTRQRWYAGKGRVPRLRQIGAWSLPTTDDGVEVRTLLVMDDEARPPVLYQVPVTERRALLPGAGHHLIGRIDSGAYLYDGPHDPAYQRALVAMLASSGSATGEGAEADAALSAAAPHLEATPATGRVLDGEQSNTSIIIEGAAGIPVICKVYRQLHHGPNPDVILQTALAESGSARIARAVGSVSGEWDDSGRTSGRAIGHLAFAQEFLPGVEDAWRVALRAAAAGEDFTQPARELGIATAETHQALARLFPTHPSTIGDVTAIVLGWHQRLAVAIGEVPQIAEYRDEIEAIYDSAQAEPWPEFQRIHGDFHLGQAIDVPGRGWVLLDFEGEPMRTMLERNRPDLVLRDVAGMLRSFDYVAGSIALESDRSIDSLRPWASAARWAFLEGYVAASVDDPARYSGLLDAFELDKAVYEATYEARNRPDWVGIPLLGISRLLHRGHVRAASV